MNHQFARSAVVFASLLTATALSPASAQTASTAPSIQPATPSQPAASSSQPASPPSKTLVIVAEPTAKDTAKNSGSTEDVATKASDREAFFEAHLAGLHAGLTLSPDQEKLWPAVEQSIRMFSHAKADDKHGGGAVLDPEADETGGSAAADAKNTDKLDPFDAVKAAGTLLLNRGKALQSLAEAADPLYSSLTPDQKRRLPILVRSFAPNNMRLRRFLAVMTWDADLNKLERMEHRSRAEQSDGRGGHERWSRDERQDEEPSTYGHSHSGMDEHHGWNDEADETARPEDHYGQSEYRSGYGMSHQQPRYDYDSDDDEP